MSNPKAPKFLVQSTSEISSKFSELADREQQRFVSTRFSMMHGLNCRSRNRYSDIIPWDHTRVQLKVAPGFNDYINASRVNLQWPADQKSFPYIVTQGPKSSTMGDFWHMVWQNTTETGVIIMVTSLTENNREKCFKYWPTSREVPLEISADGGFDRALTVSLLQVSTEAHYSLSKFQISSSGAAPKTIYHYYYSGWKDYNIPPSGSNMYDLSMNANQQKSIDTPLFVHCSAGIGRSGTFIALDYAFQTNLLERVGHGDFDPIFDLVDQMRKQRPGMVQQVAQYKYIYDTLYENWKQRENLSSH